MVIRFCSKMHPNAKYLPDNLRDEEWRWTVHCSARRGGWESERWLRRCRFCWKTPFLVALCNKLAKTMRESLRKLELSPPPKTRYLGLFVPLEEDSSRPRLGWSEISLGGFSLPFIWTHGLHSMQHNSAYVPTRVSNVFRLNSV